MADCVEGVVGQEGEEVVNGEGNEHVGMEEEEIGHQNEGKEGKKFTLSFRRRKTKCQKRASVLVSPKKGGIFSSFDALEEDEGESSRQPSAVSFNKPPSPAPSTSPTPPRLLGRSDKKKSLHKTPSLSALQQNEVLTVDLTATSLTARESRGTNKPSVFSIEDGPDVKYGEGKTGPIIRAASLEKLFEAFVGERCAPSFRKAFILTYASFTDAFTLFDHLISLYKKGLTAKGDSNKICGRVVANLRAWMDENPHDFIPKIKIERKKVEKEGEEKDLCALLFEFFEFLEESGNKAVSHAKILRSMLEKKRKALAPYSLFSSPPDSPMNDVASWIEADTQHVAEQITLWMSEFYCRISPVEITVYVKGKVDKPTACPNLSALIKKFNHLSDWVTTSLCTQYRRTARAMALANMAHLGTKLFQLNNFHGASAVSSALNNSIIGRLNQTRTVLETMPEAMAKYQEFKTLAKTLSPAKSYKDYRFHLHTQNPPCVPHVGIFLTDMTFLSDGNPDFVDGGLINFNKRFKIAGVISEFQDYQVAYPNLKRDFRLQSFLDSIPSITKTEEENYHISKCLDPKNQEETIENLLRSEQQLAQQNKLLTAQIASLTAALSSSPSSPSSSIAPSPSTPSLSATPTHSTFSSSSSSTFSSSFSTPSSVSLASSPVSTFSSPSSPRSPLPPPSSFYSFLCSDCKDLYQKKNRVSGSGEGEERQCQGRKKGCLSPNSFASPLPSPLPLPSPFPSLEIPSPISSPLPSPIPPLAPRIIPVPLSFPPPISPHQEKEIEEIEIEEKEESENENEKVQEGQEEQNEQEQEQEQSDCSQSG